MKTLTLLRFGVCLLLTAGLLPFNQAYAYNIRSGVYGYSSSSIRDTVPELDSTQKIPRFEKVDSIANFPGGETAWLNFLSQNLDGDIPVKRNAPSGKYTVLIQFVIDKEGYISDIKKLTNWGYGMEEEVIRILKMSPPWQPASKNGQPLKAYRKQPVTFVVTVGRKAKRQ